MKLHELQPNFGAKRSKKRVGRGPGAGQGKTAGKGTKGQSVRQGAGGKLYRQGGNLPFFRRLPFMRGEGFTPPSRVEYNEVNKDGVKYIDNIALSTTIEEMINHIDTNGTIKVYQIREQKSKRRRRASRIPNEARLSASPPAAPRLECGLRQNVRRHVGPKASRPLSPMRHAGLKASA